MYDYIETNEGSLGEKKFLIYRIHSEDFLDTVEVEMLKNNEIEGVVSCSKTQNNEDISLMYDITRRISLKQFWGGIVRWEDLVKIFSNIAKTIKEVEYYMMDADHFILNTSLIFVDTETRMPKMLFIPVKNDAIEKISWREFFQDTLLDISYDTRDNSEYLALVRAYLTDQTLSLTDFTKKICEIGVEKKGENEKDVLQKPKTSASTNDISKNSVEKFVQNQEIEKKAEEMPVIHVPSDVSVNNVKSDYLSSSKEERGINGLHLFGKKTKKEKIAKEKPVKEKLSKNSKKVSNSGFSGFEIPGQEKTSASILRGNAEKKSDTSKVQKVSETILVQEDERSFEPYLIEKTGKRKIPIDKEEFKIGRDPDVVDYVTQNQTVGRFHAVIVVDSVNKEAYVRDINSKNKTYVGGHAIQSNINVLLQDGVQIRFGRDEYIFRTQ